MAFINKLKSGLTRTRESVLTGLQRVASIRPKIDEELLEEVEEILISSDIGVDTTISVIENVRQRVSREHISEPAKLQELIKQELKSLLDGEPEISGNHQDFFSNMAHPFVIMVVGVNGTGKTTTIGKLAYQFNQKGKKVLLAASDTFRAAASEQLQIWAERSGSHIILQQSGADPAAVAFDAMNAALSRNVDVVIIDTAGRLHTKINLMEELKKVKRVIGKKLEQAPHEVLLVLDSTVGQNAKKQVEEFSRAVDLTGIVLTKLDGTAKGGVVLAIVNEFNIPVKFIGIGEKIEDLQPFDSNAFIDAIFS